jgi:hypothetical protein
MKYLLWFLSIGMTFAFVNLAWLHKTPEEALILGLGLGAVSTAIEAGAVMRVLRWLGWGVKRS